MYLARGLLSIKKRSLFSFKHAPLFQSDSPQHNYKMNHTKNCIIPRLISFQVLECLRGTSPSSSATGSPRRDTPTDEIESAYNCLILKHHLPLFWFLLLFFLLLVFFRFLVCSPPTFPLRSISFSSILLFFFFLEGSSQSRLSEATLSWQEIDRLDNIWLSLCTDKIDS